MRRAADRHLAVSTWLRLLHGYAVIERELRRAVADHCTFPQFDVLSQLDRERDGLTFVELSRRLLVTAGNLTGIVDRLHAEGLVRRSVDPADRRAFRLTLTPKGRRLVRRAQRHQQFFFGQLGLEIEDLVLEAPLLLSEGGSVAIQVRVGEPDEDGAASIAIVSRPQHDEEAEWTAHATGTTCASARARRFATATVPSARRGRAAPRPAPNHRVGASASVCRLMGTFGPPRVSRWVGSLARLS